jgi:nucleotide-binding universal stress UspA family protein
MGGASCIALGLYQALAVPSAGVLAALWLSAGAILYGTHLAPSARTVDASAEGLDPQLIRLRGRAPLVLVPIANPVNAGALVRVAAAVAPEGVARMRLLTVVAPHVGDDHETLAPPLVDAQRVLGGALSAALRAELRPEALVTLSDDPWSEIERVAVRSSCELILLGVGALGRSLMLGPLDRLMASVSADVVILRAPAEWSPELARRILVPARGGRAHSPTRARLLGSLGRQERRDVTFLGILPGETNPAEERAAAKALRRLAHNEAPGAGTALVVRNDDVVGEVVARSSACDLMILGLHRTRGRRAFGSRILDIAEATTCPLLMISQGG